MPKGHSMLRHMPSLRPCQALHPMKVEPPVKICVPFTECVLTGVHPACPKSYMHLPPSVMLTTLDTHVHTGEHRRMSSKNVTDAASIHNPTLVSSFASKRRSDQRAPITDLQRNADNMTLGLVCLNRHTLCIAVPSMVCLYINYS